MKTNDFIAACGFAALVMMGVLTFWRNQDTVSAQIQQQTSIPCYIAGGLGSSGAVVSASCRNVPVTLKGISFISTSGTLAYLRLYNTRTPPVCTSATGFVESIPIPSAMTGSGVVDIVRNFQYSQGLAFCLTGGPAATDNAPPPSGVFGVIALSN